MLKLSNTVCTFSKFSNKNVQMVLKLLTWFANAQIFKHKQSIGVETISKVRTTLNFSDINVQIVLKL